MATETLEIYAPLAGRLGISQIKCELEDLCLKYLDPEAYEYLVSNISEKLSERQEFVNSIVGEIKDLMKLEGVTGEVFGRPKHFKVYNLVAFSTFTMLSNHHLHLVPKLFITP